MMWVIFDGYELCEEVTAEEARQLNENWGKPNEFAPWAEWVEPQPGETLYQAANRAWENRQPSGEFLFPEADNASL